MSDLMLIGVLRMPVTPQSDELTLMQYIDRGRQAANLIEQQAAEIEALKAHVEQLHAALRHLRHNAKASGAEMGLALDVAEEALEAVPQQSLAERDAEVARKAFECGFEKGFDLALPIKESDYNAVNNAPSSIDMAKRYKQNAASVQANEYAQRIKDGE